MKVSIGCSVKEYFVGKGDTVIASWAVEQFGFKEGNKYVVKDISPTKNLIIENENGETNEYDTVYFSPCF
ncbi:hypothetical protein [Bacillus sp. NPDC094106]|uniref:hypothetical protein n=1 Tax=Bacillus sp. NPDC094106 TaxID=3363949 RepID=UPI0037FA6AE7